MYKVSVIVPIYNVEEFIDESIQSIINQTFNFEDVEVILVDDCSTDKSGDIAKSYAEKYENISYTCLEKNSGMAGKPRNVGIDMAQGKYIMFLDSDDIYIKDAIESMYNCIEKEKVTFVTANWRVVDIKGVPVESEQKEEKNSTIISIDEPFIATRYLKHACHLKIINKDFLIDNNIKFLEGVPSEDAYFTSKMFLTCKKAYFLDKQIVLYRQRDVGNVSETKRLNERFFERTMIAKRSIHELFMQSGETRYFKLYYLESILYYLERLVYSKEIESIDKKIDILNRSKDFLDLWKSFGFPVSMPDDKYNILKLFDYENIGDMKTYLMQLQEEYQKVEFSKASENGWRIVDKIRPTL